MFKRLLVVLVAVFLLDVGVAFAGTAGMTGLWTFDGTFHDGTGGTWQGDLTGVFNFSAGNISLGYLFYGEPLTITGPLVDVLNGEYVAEGLALNWAGSPVSGSQYWDQYWEITDLGNGTASVVSHKIVFFGPPGDPPNYIIAGTLSAVPLPGALWLVGAGLAGLAGVARRRK